MPRQPRIDRVLFYYPIIHAQTDLGTLGDISHQIIKDKIGQESLVERIGKIDQLWERIRKSVNELGIDYKKTRIYQDGLPVCGYEDNIVTDLANNGSINHQIILELQNKGSMLMGTECSELLLEEYNLIKMLLLDGNTSGSMSDPDKLKQAQTLLLHQRDKYVASRINETLCKGESGILFVGLLHKIEKWLDKDIHVIHPIEMQLSTKK